KPLGEEKTRAGKGKRGRKRKGMCLEDRPILEVNAAGIDICAREIFVAVPPDRDEHPVRVFSTFTEDLEKMAQWLASCGITTVAMESTGVYWIPLYDVVEKHGVKACLVDARGMKNVPGRRSEEHTSELQSRVDLVCRLLLEKKKTKIKSKQKKKINKNTKSTRIENYCSSHTLY